MTDQHIRTRVAPSPTGEIHVGFMGTLLKNYAFARKHSGEFILRIEDTDQEREVPGAVERLQATIRAYGLEWDEGPDIGGPHAPYTQSERLAVYRTYADQLVTQHHAYHCFCSKDRLEALRDAQRSQKTPPKYDRTCRSLSPEEVAENLAAGRQSVIRLAVPDNQTVTFTDLIRGEISFSTSDVDDQVLLKSDGFPTYHLAVVIDDHLMKISHIMRGEEWISSTPKHILLYQAFNWKIPVYAHLPVYLNPDGKGKMSKRKGTVSAQVFLDQGYLPEALLNFFMILGWGRDDQRELMTLDEYIAEFDPKDMSPKSVVFDLQKLDWINGIYIRQMSQEALQTALDPFIPAAFPREKLSAVLPLIFERLVKLSDFEELTSFFYAPELPDTTEMLKKGTPELVRLQLSKTQEALTKLEEWNHEAIMTTVRSLQEQHEWKKKQYFMMLRVASTGRSVTPPLFETLEVFGKDETLERLSTAAALVT
jgi:glutamyl-tRNA synthetase